MSDLNPSEHPPGTRCLIREHHWTAEYLNEVTVVEWSKNGRRVKLRHPNGHESWENLDCDGLRVEDVLESLSNKGAGAKRGRG